MSGRSHVAAAMALALVGWSVTTRVAVAAPATSDLHAVILADGGVHHAIRFSSDGRWNGFNNASPAATVPAATTGVATAAINGDLHVLLVTAGPASHLYHGVRNADGPWRGFTDVSGFASLPASTAYRSVAAANVNGDLHVLLVTGEPVNLYHAIRSSSTGAWAGFNPVGRSAGIPGTASTVAAAGIGGELHVLITMTTGGGLHHAIRLPSGRWNGFNDVGNVARVPGPSVWAVAAAPVAGDLQVVIKTNTDVLYHGLRFSATGAWAGFNAMAGPTTVPSGVSFPSISVAGVGVDLQVLIADSAGKLYHALRRSSSGAWNGFNDVSCCATFPNPGMPSGPMVVAAAGT